MKILLISKENKEKLSHSENLGISLSSWFSCIVAQDDNEIEMTKFLIVKLADSVSSFHTSLALCEF